MKQNIYIAALLAGMLALAGCGGGGSAQEPVSNDPPLGQDDCDAGTIFSEGACLTQGQIADAAEQATEEAAKEAAATIVTNARAAIVAATTLAGVNAVIGGLDQDAISQKDYAALQGEATARKGSISADAVQAAKDAINAAGKDADVDFQLRTAKENNPNILATAHDELEMAATNRKAAIQMDADQKRNSDSAAAVQAAIDKIKAAATLDEVTAAVDAANANTEILQSEKDKDADDAGSYQIAAADKRRMLSSASQLADLGTAGGTLMTDLGVATNAGDAVTQEQIDDAKAALAALKTAIDNADAVAEELLEPYETQRDDAGIDTLESRRSQVAALEAAEAEVIRLTGWTQGGFGGFQPTRAEHTAIDTAVQALRTLLEDESDNVVDNGMYWATALVAEGWAEGQDDRLTALETGQQNQDSANALAMASKLYAGISAPTAVDATNARHAEYGGTGDSDVHVSISGITPTDGTVGSPAALKEDETATVAPLHGWTGQRFERSESSEGTYEAHVYSHIEKTMGDKFGQVGMETAATGYEYGLTSDGVLVAGISLVDATAQGRITLDGFARTAGTETYKFPENNPGNAQLILVPGSFHGVPGTFRCDPAGASCTASVSTNGIQLSKGSDTWTFKPADANARVTDSGDTDYASFGWWLHKSADDKTYTASAFHDYKGMDDSTIDLPEAGTATYMGGAAGKYALASSTGGTNEAGHFTARAMLMAKFGSGAANMVEGTINDFKVGDAGESRAWSVKLKEGAATDEGAITGPADGTAWTMVDDSADASGEWSGQFREQGTDGVPGVVTGTFYTEFGRDGKMVGAFGATGQ